MTLVSLCMKLRRLKEIIFLWTFPVLKFRHYGAKDGDDSDDDGKDGDDGDGDVRHLRSPDLRIISSHHHCCQSLCQRHEG